MKLNLKVGNEDFVETIMNTCCVFVSLLINFIWRLLMFCRYCWFLNPDDNKCEKCGNKIEKKEQLSLEN